jgi:hypothetical protein
MTIMEQRRYLSILVTCVILLALALWWKTYDTLGWIVFLLMLDIGIMCRKAWRRNATTRKRRMCHE